uniref:DEAD/DEAH-box helicase domain-containing protein n=1 Tax=Moniliophthora roreri TaxID=221103 RepID=A0A0W0GC50_MONRR
MSIPKRHSKQVDAKPHPKSKHPSPQKLLSQMKRTSLSSEDINNLINKIQETYWWTNTPQPHQVKEILAQLNGRDAVIVAGMGAGKTAIAAGPHVHPRSKGRVTIMVSPLIALQTEQTFKDDFGLKAIAMNSSLGSCTMQILNYVIHQDYHILIISLEILLSQQLVNTVL